MIARARIVIAIGAAGAAACGDGLPDDDPITAVSGSRLAVQWYRYTDGALQPGPALYDLAEHTACEPATMRDGVGRCVPIADEAVYVDATCTALAGRQQLLNGPTHFWLHERIGGRPVVVGLFRAGARIADVGRFWERRDDVCLGPFDSPDGVIYRALTGEVPSESLPVLRERELGDGPVVLVVRDSDDGLRLPLRLRDRARNLPCTPMLRPDGTSVCAPTSAPPATAFGDPTCEEPAVVVPIDALVPTVVATVDPSGCPSYRVLGPELGAPVYRRPFGFCAPVTLAQGDRVFAVGAPAALPALERTVEAVAGRRLQRVALFDGSQRVVDDLLFDTATRASCRRHQDPGAVTRCIPADLPPATLARVDCTAGDFGVVEVPVRTCQKLAFASLVVGDRLEVHTIGATVLEPLVRFDGELCQALVPTPGTEVRALGPALEPDTFLGAISFGER